MKIISLYLSFILAEYDFVQKISAIIENSRATGIVRIEPRYDGLSRNKRFFASPFSNYLQVTRGLIKDQKCSSLPCQKSPVKWNRKVFLCPPRILAVK